MRGWTSLESRAGASLVELMVGLTILGIGAALSARTLELAARELDAADLGARATLLLSELHDGVSSGFAPGEQIAGPGILIPSADSGAIRVEYHPPSGGGREGEVGAGSGYHHPRSWSLPRRP